MAALHILKELADGRFHSGQQLATQLGISRTAVWKQIQRIQHEWGLAFDAVQGRGYRLTQPLQLLERETILQALQQHQPALPFLPQVEVLAEIDSTNRYLMQEALAGDSGPRVCLAERQTQGQGRRGRHWFSPFGCNLYLSLLWTSPRPMHQLAGLSLALGVVAAETLHQLGFTQVGLKWPNDLVVAEKKLGGMLIQVHGDQEGPTRIIFGLGLNLRMSAADAQRAIDQPWTELAALGSLPERTQLASALIIALLLGLQQYDGHGLEPFYHRYQRLDHFRDAEVRLLRGNERIEGHYIGIAKDGAVILRTAAGEERFHAGEISLRRCEGRQ